MPKLSKVTITPAIITPTRINGKAFLKGTPKTKAATEPVQAPVTGKGIATKVMSAKAPKILKRVSCFFLVLSKSQVKNLLKNTECSESHLETDSKKRSKKTIGKILPQTE